MKIDNIQSRLHHFLTGIALLTLLFAGYPVSAQDQEGAAAGGGPVLVDAVFQDAKADIVAAFLSNQIPNSVNIYGKAVGDRISIIAQEQPIEQVLQQIANSKNWVYWQEETGDYALADQEYYRKEVLPERVIQKVFRPNNVKASELDKAIRGALTPGIGSTIADDRTNKLIVNDLPQALERIERLIREIDVQLVIRVFYIRHAEVEEIAQKIESYKSGPGTIEVDEKTHQIIVTDLLSNIKKMELLIDILDVGPEIVIYDINNIGIDGEDLEELSNIIETIRTPDLLFEVNEKQGVFILEDVPEVHERVEQILAGFDKPVKQVLIQGEIMTTSFSREFNLGVQSFSAAQDLLDADAQGAVPDPPFGTGFVNIRDIFPNVTLDGNTVTGRYLSSHVAIQYQTVFQDSSTQVLLQPRLLVKNQESSRIFVGSEEPITSTFFNDTVDGGFTQSVTQSTITSGLTFEATPSISNSFLIELEIDINNDSAREPQRISGPDGSTQILVGRDRQNIRTTLQIPSGQTRMIGGLITNTSSNTKSGVPFLSTLPIIGHLFGFHSDSQSRDNLMLFITPTVVEDNIPRDTTVDGRRGRLVTDYERVPGEYETDFGEEPAGDIPGEGEQLFDVPEAEEGLLSGDAAEERSTLKTLRERQQEALERARTEAPLTTLPGGGSISINEGGQGVIGGGAAPPAATGAPGAPVPAERPGGSRPPGAAAGGRTGGGIPPTAGTETGY